jgi:hypothetical protein
MWMDRLVSGEFLHKDAESGANFVGQEEPTFAQFFHKVLHRKVRPVGEQFGADSFGAVFDPSFPVGQHPEPLEKQGSFGP